MVLKVVFHLRGYVRHDKDEKRYVSFCPPLDQWSQADTKEAAKVALRESVSLLLATSYTHGKLDDVLKNAVFAVIADADVDAREHVANPLMTEFGTQFDFKASLELVAAATAVSVR